MRSASLVVLAVFAAACGDGNPAAPDYSRIAVSLPPNQPRTVAIPDSFPYVVPGGVLLPKGSGLLSIDVWAALGRPAPRAELALYLMSEDDGGEYCGQNSPDAPVFLHREEGSAIRYTVTGFRIHTLPCDVRGVRAILHTRIDPQLLTPPTADQTIVETRGFERFVLRRE